MAFATGVFGAIAVFLLEAQSDYNFNILIVILVAFFADKFTERKWIKNENIYALLKAIVSYVVFFAVGLILIEIEPEGSIGHVGLVVWGMLPVAIVFTNIKSKNWTKSEKAESLK